MNKQMDRLSSHGSAGVHVERQATAGSPCVTKMVHKTADAKIWFSWVPCTLPIKPVGGQRRALRPGGHGNFGRITTAESMWLHRRSGVVGIIGRLFPRPRESQHDGQAGACGGMVDIILNKGILVREQRLSILILSAE